MGIISGICWDYSAEGCEGNEGSFKVMWKSVEEFDEWVDEGKVIPGD